MPDTLRVRLDWLDEDNSVATGMALPTEEVNHVISRQPVVIPIPSTDKNGLGDPVAYALDFGMMSEQIVLTVVCADQRGAWDTEDDGVIAWPNKQEILNHCRRGWKTVNIETSGGDIEMAGGYRLVLDEGRSQGVYSYQGVILGVTANRLGGDTKWTLKITFQVVNWPPDQGGL